jgi:uncharacterized protein DUF6545
VVSNAILVTLIAAAAAALAVDMVRWVRIAGVDPDRARRLRTAVAFRLLLAVCLALGHPGTYRFVAGWFGVPALPQLLQHLAALAVAHHVQGRVFGLVLPHERARAATRAWAVVMLLAMAGLITFYLLGPLPNRLPDMASDRAGSPFVVEYQLIVVGYVGLTAASLLRFGVRYGRHAAPGPLRTALYLVGAGGGLVVLSLVDRFVHLIVIAGGGSLPWRETGVGAAQLYLLGPATLSLLLGLTMPRWHPRLSTWRRRRRWYRHLRPLWLAVYRVDNDIALLPPRSGLVEALTLHRIGFRLHRRVIEIRDALVGPLRDYLDPEVLDQARRLATVRGLAEPARSAAAEAACIAAALRSHARRELAHPGHPTVLTTEATDLDAEATWLAAISRAMRTSEVVTATLG